MPRDELREQGWSMCEYDDQFLDTVDKFNAMLKPHGLEIELYDGDEELDGFQPVRIVPVK